MSTNREVSPGNVGLWEMINYQLMPLVMMLKFLGEEATTLEDKIRVKEFFAEAQKRNPELTDPPTRITAIVDGDIARVKAFLDQGRYLVRSMSLPRTEDRIARFEVFLGNPRPLKPADMLAEVKALRDAIEDDCRFKRLHLYRDDRSLLVSRVQGDWHPAFNAFPSAQKDIEVASDCYALGHYTASVFHLMRVAELGLRAVAKERKVKLAKDRLVEWAEWGEILKGIEDARREIQFKAKAGPRKDEALSFYSGALAHLVAFKDQYRNSVSHVRKDYEEWEAQIALNHVRDFMNGLSPRLTEQTSRPINWRL